MYTGMQRSIRGLLFALLASTSCPAANPAAQLDHIMQARSAAGDFNGTVLVAQKGRVIYERAFGFANLEWKVSNDTQTKFEIGSMTKQFTAFLISQLVNERRLILDGHISDYLPYYRKDTGRRITIHELLSHTLGFPIFWHSQVS